MGSSNQVCQVLPKPRLQIPKSGSFPESRYWVLRVCVAMAGKGVLETVLDTCNPMCIPAALQVSEYNTLCLTLFYCN